MAEDDVTPPEEAAPEEEPASGESPPTESPPTESPAADEPPAVDEPPAADEPPPKEPPRPGPPPGEPSLDELAAQIRALPIGPFLLSTVSTLASIAYGKLEARQLDDARGAIDAIGALVPVLEGRVEPQVKRDFEQALANLRVAYADASAKASS